MPRPINVRKERTTLEPEREVTPQSVQVAQSQRLYPVRAQTRGLDNFVSDLGQFAHKYKRDEDAAFTLKGEADAARGTVDQELMESRKAYATGVNGALGEADAAIWSTRLQQEAVEARQAARARGEEWDAEAFFAERQAEVLQGEQFSEDTYAVRWGRHFDRTKQVILEADARATAAEEAAQAEAAIQTLVFAQFVAGSGFEEGVTKDYAESVGLDPQERVKATVEGVKSFIVQTTNLDDLQRAEDYLEKMPASQKGLFGDDLANAIRTARNRIETADAETSSGRTLAHYRARDNFDLGFKRAVENKGDLSEYPARLDELHAVGAITDAEYSKRLSRLEEAGLNRLQAAQERQQSIRVLNDPTGEEARGLTLDQRETVAQNLQDVSKEVAGNLNQLLPMLADANTSEEEKQAALYETLGQLAPLVKNAPQLGVDLKFYHKELNQGTNPDTRNFAANARIHDAMVDMYGYGALSGVNNEALDNYEAYNTLVNVQGLTPEDAVLALTRPIGGRTFPASETVVLKSAAWKDLEDDLDGTPEMLQRGEAIRDMAAYQYMITGNAERAVEYATKRVDETYMSVDGNLVPRAGLPPDFGDLYEDNRDYVVGFLAEEGYIEDKDSDVRLIPYGNTQSSGQFRIMSNGTFLADDDGGHLVISGEELKRVFIAGQSKEEDAALRQRKEVANAQADDPNAAALGAAVAGGKAAARAVVETVGPRVGAAKDLTVGALSAGSKPFTTLGASIYRYIRDHQKNLSDIQKREDEFNASQ